MSYQVLPPGRGKRLLGTMPPDLAVVVGYVLGFDVAVASPLVRETPLRPLLALPVLLFLPGYVLVAVLFPAHGGDSSRSSSADVESREAAPSRSVRRIDLVERTALSFGTSLAILPWFGLLLPGPAWRARSGVVLGGLSVLVIAGAVLGTARRLRLPEDERFDVPWRRWIAGLRSAVFGPASPVDAAVNAALLVSLTVAMSALAYGLVVPNHQMAYTDFYLVTENETGTAIAGAYPTDFALGEGRQLTVGVKNRERRRVGYVVVVELQRVRLRGDSVAVLEERELDRLRADVAANTTWTRRLTIVPEQAGEDLRLQFYLYTGDPPRDPGPETAYRHLYLWIDVSDPERDRVGEPVADGRN